MAITSFFNLIGTQLFSQQDVLKSLINRWIWIRWQLTPISGNSYIQNLYAPDEDPNLLVEHYDRTDQDDDDLGIKHMKTENYGETEDLW